MTVKRTPSPSPPVGEGAERALASEAGEGALGRYPSPASRQRRSSPSPTGGEGREQLPRSAPSTRTSFARALRKNMTDAERKLWFALRDRRFANFKFRRQVPTGRFIADFICFERRVVIEVDGGQHLESQHDKERDLWFAGEGFVTLRYWNNDVLKNLEGVLTVILDVLHKQPPHPDRAERGRPSPAGGEGKKQVSP